MTKFSMFLEWKRPLPFIRFTYQSAAWPHGTQRRWQRKLGAILTGAILLLALSQTSTAHADTITVDGTNCLLADAITTANTGVDTGFCTGGSAGPDTIDLQTNVLLSSPLPTIISTITLEGNSHTINGNNISTVLYIEAGDLTLNDTTITGGAGVNGGGVFNNGTFTANNSVISGNSAMDYGGGIFNNGEVTLNNSTINNNSTNRGGGISTGGLVNSVTLNNSTISGNTALYQGGGLWISLNAIVVVNHSIISGNSVMSGNGGGIHNSSGNLTLNYSHVSNNTAVDNGGGILNASTFTANGSTFNGNSAAFGAGIYSSAGMVLNNTTISGNMAALDGGGIHSSDTATLNNSTITNNLADASGGGLYNNNALTLNRSLISGNISFSGGMEIFNDGAGSITADNSNVLGHDVDDNAAAFDGFTPCAGGGCTDISATNNGTNPTALGSILNPILSDNGGPTLTHALVSGSPALDTATTAVCTTSPINNIDQRGAARNFDADASPGTDCDSGAVEFHESITVGSCSGTPLTGLQMFLFAASGQSVSIDIANGNGLTCLTVEEMGPGANHLLATGPGTSDPALLTNNWWHISGDVETGLDVAITLPYASADADSRVCKWPGELGGFGWDCGDGVNTIFSASTVTRNNVTGFSDWAVGDNVGPTAVSLQDFSTTETNSIGVIAGVIGSLAAALGLLLFRAWRKFYQSS